MSTMIANAMFFGVGADSDGSVVIVSMGTVSITTHTLLISVYATLVVLPVNLLIVTLFRKSKPKYHWDLPADIAKKQSQAPNDNEVRKILFPTEKSLKGKSAGDEETGAIYDKKQPELGDDLQEPEPDIPMPVEQKWWKQRYPLPHWCIYVGYVLAFVSCAIAFTFCFLYSLQWGGAKSNKWMAALFLSFFQDVILIQPIKVSYSWTSSLLKTKWPSFSGRHFQIDFLEWKDMYFD